MHFNSRKYDLEPVDLSRWQYTFKSKISVLRSRVSKKWIGSMLMTTFRHRARAWHENKTHPKAKPVLWITSHTHLTSYEAGWENCGTKALTHPQTYIPTPPQTKLSPCFSSYITNNLCSSLLCLYFYIIYNVCIIILDSICTPKRKPDLYLYLTRKVRWPERKHLPP